MRPEWNWREFYEAVPREYCKNCKRQAWTPTHNEGQWTCGNCGAYAFDSYPGKTPLVKIPDDGKVVPLFRSRSKNWPHAG